MLVAVEREPPLASPEAASAVVSDTSLASTTSIPVPATARIVNVAGLVTVDTKSVLSLTIPGNPGTMLSFTPDYATAPSQTVGANSIRLPGLEASGEPHLLRRRLPGARRDAPHRRQQAFERAWCPLGCRVLR